MEHTFQDFVDATSSLLDTLSNMFFHLCALLERSVPTKEAGVCR